MKTKTKALRPSHYISNAGQLSLAKLTDDALERLASIRACGVGRQRGRSRGVITRSYRAILVLAGYTEAQAWATLRDQLLALDELNANAEE